MTVKQLQAAVLFYPFSVALDVHPLVDPESIWSSMNDDLYFQAQVIKTCLVGIFVCVLFAKIC